MSQESIISSKGNILVVDDNPANLNVLTEILSLAGYKVRPASNGKFALMAVRATPPDLILLDILMPEMDGYEVCSQLKASPTTKDIPVIFVSALDEVVDKVKAFSSGGVDYITKPLEIQEVLVRVENQLRLRRMSEQLAEQNARLHKEIEERQQVEEALRKSETCYRELVESQDLVLVCRWNSDTTLTFVNQSYCRFFGKSSEELLGRKFLELLPDKQTQEQLWDYAQSLVSDLRPETSEHVMVSATGEKRWFRWTDQPIIDKDGRLVEFQSFGIDITDRKQAEAAIASSERQYRNLVETSQDIIWSVDADGHYTFVNQAVKQIYGYSPEEMIGRPFSDFLAPEEIAKDIAVFQRLLKGASLFHYETTHLAKDGRPINLMLNAIALRDSQGNIVGTTGTASDITERIQGEEALRRSEAREREKARELELTLRELKHTQTQLIQTEKMSSLGRMVAGVAHEINNPVSFIYGNLTPARQYFQHLMCLIELYQQTYPHPTPELRQLAQEIDLDFLVEDWSKLVDSMQVGAERIHQIVQSLKLFSRLDTSELKPVDIHEGIDNTLLILHHRLRAVGNANEIEVIKDYGELPKVTCYASQLNQVFMNLLNNAIDALETQPAPRVISIRTSIQNSKFKIQNGRLQFVVIRIADNGSGIGEEVLHHIFDPFFTTKPVGSGTGLGLSISHQIVVEKHKGKISCVSGPGKGTEFIVEIPVTQEHLLIDGCHCNTPEPILGYSLQSK